MQLLTDPSSIYPTLYCPSTLIFPNLRLTVTFLVRSDLLYKVLEFMFGLRVCDAIMSQDLTDIFDFSFILFSLVVLFLEVFDLFFTLDESGGYINLYV